MGTCCPQMTKCEKKKKKMGNHQGFEEKVLSKLSLRPGQGAPGRAADWKQRPERAHGANTGGGKKNEDDAGTANGPLELKSVPMGYRPFSIDLFLYQRGPRWRHSFCFLYTCHQRCPVEISAMMERSGSVPSNRWPLATTEHLKQC